MVANLADILPSFPGTANHIRCFLHTINLVAKSLIKEFDMSRRDVTEALDDDGSDSEGSDREDPELNVDIADYDDMDGWVDEANLLSDHQRKQLQHDIRPIKLVLVKVSRKT